MSVSGEDYDNACNESFESGYLCAVEDARERMLWLLQGHAPNILHAVKRDLQVNTLRAWKAAQVSSTKAE